MREQRQVNRLVCDSEYLSPVQRPVLHPVTTASGRFRRSMVPVTSSDSCILLQTVLSHAQVLTATRDGSAFCCWLSGAVLENVLCHSKSYLLEEENAQFTAALVNGLKSLFYKSRQRAHSTSESMNKDVSKQTSSEISWSPQGKGNGKELHSVWVRAWL